MDTYKLENVRCDLCGSDNAKPIGFVTVPESVQHASPSKKLTIAQCKECGLAYTNPRPRKDLLSMFYGTDYVESTTKDIQEISQLAMACGGGSVTRDLRFYKRLLREIERLSAVRGRMLDIGCGVGWFIKFARENGWQVFGQEISGEAAEYARNKFQLDIQVGELTNLNFPAAYFDVVTIINVIEHLANPVQYLGEVNRILKPKGLLYLTTPNAISPSIRLTKGSKDFETPDHLFQFSTKSIRKILERCGFEIVKLTTLNKQDAQIGLDILKESVKNITKSVSDRSFPIKLSMAALYYIMNGTLGVRLYKEITFPNGGFRITAFARKV